MKQWWNQLQPRERLVLLLGGLSLAVITGYFLFWEPLSQERQRLRQQVAAGQALHQWMRRAAGQVESLRRQAGAGKTPGNTRRSLPGLLDASLRQGPLAETEKRLEPRDENSVRLEFNDAVFDELLQWLAGLRQQHGVNVVSANFERLSTPGRVKAHLTLSR